ncbi:putative peroxidase [Seiridium cardinale]|uniref:Peroxidase n=1 Tax=Seiridium cardinale TaxID=138064 RepID=A0ABR2Y4Q1_9PEZI
MIPRWLLPLVAFMAGSAVADTTYSNSSSSSNSSSILNGYDFSKWEPAGSNDLRCGCPAMNSLANHGFINHDGRNLTLQTVVPVLVDVFNLSEELATIVSGLGLATADDPSKGVFTLGDMNKHNNFEHDASLSRVDVSLGGDGHTFDQPTFDRFLAHFNDSEYVTLEIAAKARMAAVNYSRVTNPTFLYTWQQRITSYGETIKYMRTLVENKTGLTPLRFVKVLFEEERIPFNEGWRTATNQISGFSLASDVIEEAIVTGEYIGQTDKVGLHVFPNASTFGPGATYQ